MVRPGSERPEGSCLRVFRKHRAEAAHVPLDGPYGGTWLCKLHRTDEVVFELLRHPSKCVGIQSGYIKSNDEQSTPFGHTAKFCQCRALVVFTQVFQYRYAKDLVELGAGIG